jgi:hypothetical protein
MMQTCALPVDRLLLELRKHEAQLRAWMARSEDNAVLFVKDPPAALRAANLGMPEETIVEFESVLQEIARRLNMAPDVTATGLPA